MKNTRKESSTRTRRRKSKPPKLSLAAAVVLVIAIGAYGAYIAHSSREQVRGLSAPSGKVWTLLYEDGFNGDSLNAAKWHPYHNTYGDGNQEEACLTPNNVAVSGGSLKITALRENINCPGKPMDNFSSGFIGSRETGTYYPAFAKYEIRAKLPHGQGLWPAFWLRHVNGSSTAEIDVMEYFHAQVPGRTTQTLHFPAEISSNAAKKTTTFETASTSPGWHTWAVEIIPANAGETAARIIFYTDGTPTLEYTPAQSGWLNNYDKNAMFDMAINLAVGGTYSGHPDDALGYSRYLDKCLKPYNGTPPCDPSGIFAPVFPATYEVDYVRVYKLENAAIPQPPAPPPSATQSSGNGQPTPQAPSSSAPNSQSGPEPTSDMVSFSPEIFDDPQKAAQIVKVEYVVDGKVIQTRTKSPFALDLSLLSDGEITVVERITFKDGSVSEKQRTLTVDNTAARQQKSANTATQTVWPAVLAIVVGAAMAAGIVFAVRKRPLRNLPWKKLR